MEQKIMHLEKGAISLKVSKEKSRKAIVFIHGNSLHSGCFENQLQSSMFKSYQRIALDLPGHGTSERWSRYDIPSVVQCLVDVCNALDLDSFILAGHSLGGHLALQALPSMPKCKGLFLCGTPPLEGAFSFPEAFLPNPVAALLFKGPLDASEKQLFSGAMTKNEVNFDFEKSIERADPAFREGMGISLQNGGLRNEVESLEKNRIPLALVLGSNDPLISPGYFLDKPWPNLWQEKVVRVEGTGHSPFLEDPETFNTVLRDFLVHAENQAE